MWDTVKSSAQRETYSCKRLLKNISNQHPNFTFEGIRKEEEKTKPQTGKR